MDDVFAVVVASHASPAAVARALRPRLAVPVSALRDAMARGEPVHVAPSGNHNTYENELVQLVDVCDALEGTGVNYGLLALVRDPADGAPTVADWRDAERIDRSRIEGALRLWHEIGE